MMTVTPVVSNSSSTATVVSTGSPENTWLGHWARIRLRMVSRRTVRIKEENNRLDPETMMSGPRVTSFPETTNIRKGHHIFKTPPLTKYTHSVHPVNFKL